MIIKYRFKFYPHVVCDDNRVLWQLEHFKNKRTFPLKKLTYNQIRKAYRINSQWVSKKRLLKFAIPVSEEIKPKTNMPQWKILIEQIEKNYI